MQSETATPLLACAVTRLPRRCASSTITASSSGRNAGTLPPPGVMIADSPLAASLMKSTPPFTCRRISSSISALVLVSAPTPEGTLPTQAGK